MHHLTNDWASLLQDQWEAPYFQALMAFLEEEYRTQTIFPPRDRLLEALRLTSYADTKVVLLGQDPYHGDGEAHGLSFSVERGIAIPPSLRNMYKELEADIGCPAPAHGNLTSWSQQGVLLLNTVLTVRKDMANSHKGKGWEMFTDAIIRGLNRREQPVVFILWGKGAQAKTRLIDKTRHAVIESVHPSPLSAYRGFFGSKPFSKVNAHLEAMGSPKIEWQISD
ncbi:uracil-DNA glycosylase [Paenibacillus whitsoniae]|uniref:Uracil-DNA glycosylase n=1 Tax=Paenibacillus whitsoniae TaxID=2496558 RepID=A0A3S0BIB1_9BACL|nr:uracil-DNA glycosylase [Paenibacillus whitsoniae]RTE05804.1 uracil-DNA glycosylase [Paenibacillus whitsoniae]